MKKIFDASGKLSYLWKTFQLIWSSSGNWTSIWFFLLVLQGLLPIASVHATRLLVDSLVSATRNEFSWRSAETVTVPAIAMGLLLLLTQLLGSALNWIRTIQAELVQDHVTDLMHKKSIAIDMAFYESSEYYDRLERARSDASNRSLALLESSGSLLQNSITLIAMATILIPYGFWLPIALLASTLPVFYVVLSHNRKYHNWWQATTIDRRWLHYYDSLLTLAPAAPEIKLFNLGNYFRLSYKKLRSRLRQERLQLLKNQTLIQLGAGASTLLISGGAIAWMGLKTLQGSTTLGDLVLFYQAFNQGQGLMRTLLSNLGQIYNSSLFLENLFEFFSLQAQVLDPSEPCLPPTVLKVGVRIRQVDFQYPGSSKKVLQNFSLNIPAGKVVAIVGDNGAGKSTLLKLLCRFYDPTSGSIEIDGVDIRNFSIDRLREMLTVLFQFPIRYHSTAAQNIALGSLTLSSPDLDDIKAAAHNAGAHEIIANLPQGYDTLLGKWFVDGTDLSGGEWQRIALARAFVRQAQLIILDEPTSAMDPWAETDWLNRFRTLASGRTALVITHRFTLAMRADIIHMMRKGEIIESGTHAELLEQNGFYAQSWREQMEASSIPSSQANLL